MNECVMPSVTAPMAETSDRRRSPLVWLRQFVCGLYGHGEQVYQYDRTRIWLVCASCGHTTPGWDVPRKPLTLK